MRDLKAQRWFDAVRDAADTLEVDSTDDLVEAVLGAAEYYLDVSKDKDADLTVVGRLEVMLAENTGLQFFYKGIHTDALQVRKYLEMLLEGYEARRYKWFTTDEDAKAEYGKLTATDVRNYVKADAVVELLNDMIRLIADRQHMLEDIQEGFKTRGIMLSKIVDLRVAQLEEVWIDGTRETTA